MNTPLAIGLFFIAIIAAIAAGLMLRNGSPEPSARRPAPPPPRGTRPTLLEGILAAEAAQRGQRSSPMLDTYDGAVRLRRATLEAGQWLHKYEPLARDELLGLLGKGDHWAHAIFVLEAFAKEGKPLTPADALRIAETMRRPSVDVSDMTRRIVTAWIGEEEPMVRVPIMKLGDIKPEPPAAIETMKAKRLASVNRERAKLDLPPLVTLDPPPPTPLHPPATGGTVKPGRPYIVGERPQEQTRTRRPNDRKLEDEA